MMTFFLVITRSLRVPALIVITVLAIPVRCLPAGELGPSGEARKELRSPADRTVTEGVASYYAVRFNGRKTKSGALYDPEKLTAAHPDLPFGTRVRVVNPANDREVIVTVNDRCRRKGVPFIDLSRAAARELGFLGKGKVKVRFSVVDEKTAP